MLIWWEGGKPARPAIFLHRIASQNSCPLCSVAVRKLIPNSIHMMCIYTLENALRY